MAEERKIKEIREEYVSCGEDMLPSFIEEYLADGRKNCGWREHARRN